GRTIFVLFFVIGVLCGASAPGLLDLLARLPGFSLALNYRLVFLAGLGLAGLAALGVEEILAGERRGAAALAGGIAVFLAAIFFLSRGVFRDRALSDSFVASSFAAELVPLLLFAVLAALPRGTARRVSPPPRGAWCESAGTLPAAAARGAPPAARRARGRGRGSRARRRARERLASEYRGVLRRRRHSGLRIDRARAISRHLSSLVGSTT